MKECLHPAFLALSVTGLLVIGTCFGVAAGAQAAPPALMFESGTRIRRAPGSPAIRHLSGGNLSAALESMPAYQKLLAARDYAGMAGSFLSAYRREFALQDPATELSVVKTQTDPLGFHQVRLQQQLHDLPVLSAELIVQFDRQDHIDRVQGSYLPTPVGMTLRPQLQQEPAGRKALAALGGSYTLEGGRLVLYSEDFIRTRLAYEFHATRSPGDQRQLVVDANDGSLLLNVPTVLNRR